MNVKTCTKCGRILPSTTEFFYKSKAGKDGLYASCKECTKQYQKKYYNTNRDKEETTAEVHTKLENYKEKISTRYSAGQVINIRYRDVNEEIICRKKAKIIKFYTHHVLCLVDNCRECFRYQDLHNFTTIKKG